MEFKVTRQCDVFRKITDDQKFHISDNLLFDCIGIGCGHFNNPNRVQGFNSGKEFGYALLTYFASLSLGFRRLPFCEDRIYTNYFSDTGKYTNILSKLSSKRIEKITDELLRLYEHTQNSLNRIGLNEVNIRREIKKLECNNPREEQSYAEKLVMLRESSHILGIPEFEIEMDTLNSFGDEGAYVSEVRIELTVPAKDIMYCSALIGNRNGEQHTMESGEWVVINRSPTGVVKLPTASIRVRGDMWKHIIPLTPERAKKFIDNYKPIVFRPFYKHEQPHETYGVLPSLKQIIAKRFF